MTFNVRDSRLLFVLRKISPELTSTTNPPLFAEEDYPWANICAHLPPFFFICGTPATAWLINCALVWARDPKGWSLGSWSRVHELNHCTTGLVSEIFHFLKKHRLGTFGRNFKSMGSCGKSPKSDLIRLFTSFKPHLADSDNGLS